MNVKTLLDSFLSFESLIDYVEIESHGKVHVSTTLINSFNEIRRHEFRIYLWIVIDFDYNRKSKTLIIHV